MLPSHRRAIADIIACRSEALGGHLWRCEACRAEVYAYHSCGNRSCPRCHGKQTERWLAARTAELLDAPYFHITMTVPAELRAVLRANQRDGYALLMKAAAGAIIELARDPRHVGAQVGVLAVLHTWTQQLHYHPHVRLPLCRLPCGFRRPVLPLRRSGSVRRRRRRLPATSRWRSAAGALRNQAGFFAPSTCRPDHPERAAGPSCGELGLRLPDCRPDLRQGRIAPLQRPLLLLVGRAAGRAWMNDTSLQKFARANAARP
jgi:hypothetical protein